jgi:hypothetical protein
VHLQVGLPNAGFRLTAWRHRVRAKAGIGVRPPALPRRVRAEGGTGIDQSGNCGCWCWKVAQADDPAKPVLWSVGDILQMMQARPNVYAILLCQILLCQILLCRQLGRASST